MHDGAVIIWHSIVTGVGFRVFLESELVATDDILCVNCDVTIAVMTCLLVLEPNGVAKLVHDHGFLQVI